MSTAWRIPLACSRGRNSAKESCQSWAVGQGSVLIRAAGPGTGAVAVLQITLNLPTGCPKQVLGVVHRGKPDMKERNFHYFCVKNIPCAIKNAKKERFGICLVLGHHHPPSRRKLFPLSIPFALLGREGSACPA